MKARFTSLSQSLTIAIVGCVLFVSSLVISINLFVTSQETWQALENQADEYAAYLSGSLEQPLWTLDEPAVRRMARTIFRNDLFVRLKVEGVLMKIVYEQWAPIDIATIKREVPITRGGRHIGTLELEISTQSYHEKLDSLLVSTTLTMAAVLATLLVLTGLIFNRLLKRPLSSLLHRIDHLSQGKPVPPGSEVRHQELAEIISHFDEMATQVTSREASLRISKQRLEAEVAERKQVEAALTESEKRYRVVTDLAPVAIIVHRELDILYANSCALELLGARGPEDLMGRSLREFVHPNDYSIIDARTINITKYGKTAEPLVYRWLRLDGQELALEAVGTPVSQFGGPATLTLLRDMTQQRKDEADKARLLAQLQQSQKMEAVGTLANGIAHDFNNILQAIGGIVQLMTIDGKQSSNDLAKLREIDTAVIRGSELVSRLLTFSRKVEPKLEPVNLNQEVERSVAILERTLPKMIRLEVDLNPGIALIKGDVSQIEHVIFNLGSNAGDAMPEGGTLCISTAMVRPDAEGLDHQTETGPADREIVRLTISDDGLGMSETTREQIFDPFFTTKEVGKGTGLGLSTVYGIVGSHGGQIRCRSQEGRGTTFEIDFPVHEGDVSGLEPSQSEPFHLSNGHENILLVDDEQSILSVGQNLLENLGYSVETAQSGEEALDIYRGRGDHIDLVILDMGMPGMGGMRCLQELIAFDASVKILVASGYASENVEQDVLDAGALAFLPKPYRLGDLMAILNELLGEPGQ
jgi:PAS domain S-box-containing protein